MIYIYIIGFNSINIYSFARGSQTWPDPTKLHDFSDPMCGIHPSESKMRTVGD